jgi:hypothetical protein
MGLSRKKYYDSYKQAFKVKAVKERKNAEARSR